MAEPKKYSSAFNFRQALDERLKTMAHQENLSINDLHRQVVFDRFLSRLDPERFVLTGGYSLELRLPKSRSTTDIDVYIRDQDLASRSDSELAAAILFALRQQAEKDLDDYFSFEVERELTKLTGVKGGGIRCLVIARISAKDYHRFHIDVAVIPDKILDAEYIQLPERLSFAGVSTPPIATLQKEELFANKIHAYTRPRLSQNSRVEDLIDMALLIEDGLEKAKIQYCLKHVFASSSDHQDIPGNLSPPPAGWQKDFQLLAERRDLALSLDESFQIVDLFYKSLSG